MLSNLVGGGAIKKPAQVEWWADAIRTHTGDLDHNRATFLGNVMGHFSGGQRQHMGRWVNQIQHHTRNFGEPEFGLLQCSFAHIRRLRDISPWTRAIRETTRVTTKRNDRISPILLGTGLFYGKITRPIELRKWADTFHKLTKDLTRFELTIVGDNVAAGHIKNLEELKREVTALKAKRK